MTRRVKVGTTTWTVGRRWVHRPRWRRFTFRRGEGKPRRWWDWIDLPPDLADDPAGFLMIVVGIIALAAFVVFMIFVGGPLILFLAEGIWGLVLLIVGVLGRVLLGRPWIVEARSSDGRTASWPVKGWAKSHRAIEEAATRLSAGAAPPFDLMI